MDIIFVRGKLHALIVINLISENLISKNLDFFVPKFEGKYVGVIRKYAWEYYFKSFFTDI